MRSYAASWGHFSGQAETHPTIIQLAEASKPRHVPRGETLIQQADEIGPVFLILAGTLSAVRYSKNGHKIWLAELNPGSLVGEISALATSPRTSSVIAEEDVEALSISPGVFLDAMRSDGEFATAVTVILARRLGSTSNELESMIGLSVAARLHAELLRLARPDQTDSEMFEIVSPPSVSELANRVHATREAASRALSLLERRGLAIRRPNAIQLVAPELLES